MADIELVIKIPEIFYSFCKAQDDATEIQLAVKNGIPLDKIKSKILDTVVFEKEVHGETEFLKGVNYCLGIIDKYMPKNEEQI